MMVEQIKPEHCQSEMNSYFLQSSKKQPKQSFNRMNPTINFHSIENNEAMFTPLKGYLDLDGELWRATQYYQSVNLIQGLGQANYQQLSQLITSTWRHAQRRRNFFPLVDRHPDGTLRCVYSGKQLGSMDPNEPCHQANEEHSFPQSFQRGSRSGTGRDMHAIFAADKHTNGSRGNLIFGNQGTFIGSKECGNIYQVSWEETDQREPTGELDDLNMQKIAGKNKRNSRKRLLYEPHLNKGPLARATLYILLAFPGCANHDFFPQRALKWYLQQARNQPVSEWEMHRNQELFRLQGTRNPFIDYPEWVDLVDFNKGWQSQSSQKLDQ